MKETPLTMKLKQALSAHFAAGGTVNSVPAELSRISLENRQKCYDFWKARQARRHADRPASS